jgi:GDP-L-fucose synthase
MDGVKSELDWYRGKRVAVLGATGLIGSHCVKVLKESGAWVRAVWHMRPPNEYTRLADVVSRGSLNDPAQSYDVFRGPDGVYGHDVYGGKRPGNCVDVVVSCAGITGGIGLTKVDPISYVGPATAMACNIIHACHLAKVRCGFLSSTTVYTPREVPVVEYLAGSEFDLYPAYRGIGQSKRFLEGLCRYYHETVGLEVAIVRPSGAYGRFDNFDEGTSHVVPGMINRAMRLKPGEKFEVWGDGGDVRDLVHAEDVARGYLLAIAKKPDADPVNLASGVGITTGELARRVLEAVGSGAELEFRPDKPTALRKRLVSIEKARKELGYEPRVSLEAGLRDTVEWRRGCGY